MDLLEVIAGIQEKIGKSTASEEDQKGIDVSEAWYLWDILISKYDAIEKVDIISSFSQDKDLKVALNSIQKHFEQGSEKLEGLMLEYSVPLPERPPQKTNIVTNLDIFTDKYIFNHSFELLQGFVPILALSFIFSSTPKIKKVYKNHLIGHMEMIDNLLLFGQLKGYFPPLPAYQP